MPGSDEKSYREQAEECRRQAQKAVSSYDEESWLLLAANFLMLAENAERQRPKSSDE